MIRNNQFFKYTPGVCAWHLPVKLKNEQVYLPKICDQGLLGRRDPPEWQGWGENGLCYRLGPTLLTKSHFPNLLKCSCSIRVSSSPRGGVRKEGPNTQGLGGPALPSLSPLCCNYSCPKPSTWMHAGRRSRILWRGLPHLEAPLFFFPLGRLSSGGRTQCLRPRTPRSPHPLGPPRSSPRAPAEKSPDCSHKSNISMNAAGSHHLSHTEISDQKQRHKHWFFFPIYSPTQCTT